MEKATKCQNCGVVNFSGTSACVKCKTFLTRSISAGDRRGRIFWRIAVLLGVCLSAVFGLFLSLIVTSKPLSGEQRETLQNAVNILEEKGFKTEVRYLRHFATFRG